MTLEPRWKHDFETSPSPIQYCRPGVVCVAEPDRSSVGTTVRFLSAATGTERGHVTITDEFRGVCYRETPGLLFVTTSGDHVHAVDPETIETQWETKAGRVGPATERLVYTYGGANLWAVRAADGSQEWSTILPEEIRSVLEFSRSDGTLLLTVGEALNQKRLVSVDATTGDERFQHEAADVKEYLVEKGTVLAVVNEDTLTQSISRIDDRTGSEQWSYTLEASARVDEEDIEIRDGAICVDEGPEVGITVLNPVTGQVSRTLDGHTGMRFDKSMLHSVTEAEGDRTELHATDLETGRQSWSVAFDHQAAPLAFDHDTDDVYLGGSDGETGVVYRINGATGRVRWECPVGEVVDTLDVETSPLVAYSSLHPMMAQMFDASESSVQGIYAVDLRQGQAEWSFSSDNLNVKSTTDRHVVVTDEDALYVLRRADGRAALTPEYDSYQIAAGALFVATGSTMSAYPLTDAPAAFPEVSEGRDGNRSTAVYEANGDGVTTRETDVEQGGHDGEVSGKTAVNELGDETVVTGEASADREGTDDRSSVCPECGGDLDPDADVNFCTDCGARLTD